MESLSIKAWASGELQAKTRTAWGLLSSCGLCPRNCRVNRLKGEKGFCRQGLKAKVALALPHFGEEPPLSGSRGAGTVFFSGCALRCLYCQNYQISQEGMGKELEAEELAQLFLKLQNQGCHNLDLVSPTPHLPFIFSAIEIAISQGFCLPIVYNTHGYLSDAALGLLEGMVDIYLPDMKYGDNENASLLSQVEDYVNYNQAAVKRMFEQVGPLKMDGRGNAFQGLLVRHLVLPENKANSREVLGALAAISSEIPVSLMAQYRPCYKAHQVPEITRRLHSVEYQDIIAFAEQLDIEEIFIQELDSAEHYYPDFDREQPFLESPL
ncbi:MAG: radical SAM protein [Thermodesulfobacteriota bacterium]